MLRAIIPVLALPSFAQGVASSTGTFAAGASPALSQLMQGQWKLVAAGVIIGPALTWFAAPILRFLTQRVLKSSAWMIPAVKSGAVAMMKWLFSLPLVAAIIKAEPKACETLVDNIIDLFASILSTIRDTVDQQIEDAGLQKAPVAELLKKAPASPVEPAA